MSNADDFIRNLATKMNDRILDAMHEAKAELGTDGEGIDLSQAKAVFDGATSKATVEGVSCPASVADRFNALVKEKIGAK